MLKADVAKLVGSEVNVIEMNFCRMFMCNAKFVGCALRETLQVKYKGKSIADVLDMTVEEAMEFKNIPKAATWKL